MFISIFGDRAKINIKRYRNMARNKADYLTNYMQQGPSLEANSHSASKEITCPLWKPKDLYHIDKCPPLDIQNTFCPDDVNLMKQQPQFLGLWLRHLSGMKIPRSIFLCVS